jgi:hypothetical protein
VRHVPTECTGALFQVCSGHIDVLSTNALSPRLNRAPSRLGRHRMPDMTKALTLREIRDLVEYLSTLSAKSEPK